MSGIMNKLGLGHTNHSADVAHEAGRHHTAAASHANTGTTTTTKTTTTNNDINRSGLNNSSAYSSINQSGRAGNTTLHSSAAGMNQNSTLNTTAPYGASTNNMTARSGAAYTGQTATTGQVVQDQGLFTQQNRLSGDDAMTRSEEQLRVEKATVASGVAALDKTVSVEHVEKAIPVQRERVVIEREPITCTNLPAAMKGPEISEAHYETVLREDRVIAEKETVPVERIRLAKQVETSVESVGADLRKEHVDLTMQQFDNNKINTTGRTSGLTNDKIQTHERSGLTNEKAHLHDSTINNTTNMTGNTRNI